MKLINDQPAVVRANWLEAAVEATCRQGFEERRDEHVRLVEARWSGDPEALVPLRRAPAPVASPADGTSR